MHRTQIVLEEWQYQALRARAEQEGRSMSELVRNLLGQALSLPPRKNRLEEIKGIGADATGCGREHDHCLYGVMDRD